MKLCVITSVFNEDSMIMQFLNHYRKQGVDYFFFLDNHSTDFTRSHLDSWSDIETRTYGETDQIDDMHKLALIENTKQYASEAGFDYCILADCDEFLEPISEGHTIKSYIEQYPQEIYGSIGYNMVQHSTDKPYNPDIPLTEQRQHGFAWPVENKSIVVKSSYQCHYGAGMHDVADERHELHPNADFVLLHYVAFDREISLKRRKRNGERTKEINISRGHGIENVNRNAEYWEEWFKGHCSHPNIVKVIG